MEYFLYKFNISCLKMFLAFKISFSFDMYVLILFIFLSKIFSPDCSYCYDLSLWDKTL